MKRSPILNTEPDQHLNHIWTGEPKDDIITQNGSVTYAQNPPGQPPPNPLKPHTWHTKDRIFRWIPDYKAWIEETDDIPF